MHPLLGAQHVDEILKGVEKAALISWLETEIKKENVEDRILRNWLMILQNGVKLNTMTISSDEALTFVRYRVLYQNAFKLNK